MYENGGVGVNVGVNSEVLNVFALTHGCLYSGNSCLMASTAGGLCPNNRDGLTLNT
jgi:hypothetical protein